MAKTKTAEGLTLAKMLAGAPRVEAQIKDARTVYAGPCVVQAPGGWTRVGPTWITPVGWVVAGPGAASWGTTQGLAQLASEGTATPTWHAVGIAIAPAPNVVYAVLPDALASKAMETVRGLTEEARNV